jgi:hypothetical protein
LTHIIVPQKKVTEERQNKILRHVHREQASDYAASEKSNPTQNPLHKYSHSESISLHDMALTTHWKRSAQLKPSKDFYYIFIIALVSRPSI